MRKKIIVGNWKMNFKTSEAVEFLNSIKDDINTDKVNVAFCPSYVALRDISEVLKNNKIGVGAQNVYFEPSGTYTGEISIGMLKEFNVEYVIVGHSERRTFFNETDEAVNKKVKVLLDENIIPIVCVGENLEERQKNIHKEKIEMQVTKALEDVSLDLVKNIVIAYEPLWAINSGNTEPATSEQAEEMCAFIRLVLKKILGDKLAEKVRIQYGGSAGGKNAKELLEKPNIDGLLVGTASMKPDFVNIVNAALIF